MRNKNKIHHDKWNQGITNLNGGNGLIFSFKTKTTHYEQKRQNKVHFSWKTNIRHCDVKLCEKSKFIMKNKTYPIICVVLVLNSLNYRSWEQNLTYPHNCVIFTQMNNVYDEIKNMVLHHMSNFHGHKVAYTEFHFLLCNKAIRVKYWKEDVELWGLVLHNNSSTCPVLIPHRQLGNCSLRTWQSESLKANYICKTLNKSMFYTCQQIVYSPQPRKAYWTESWCWYVIITYVEKKNSV